LMFQRKKSVDIVRRELAARGVEESHIGRWVLRVTLPDGGQAPLTMELHNDDYGTVSLPIIPIPAVVEAGFYRELLEINGRMVADERLLVYEGTVFDSRETIRFEGEDDKPFAMRFLKSANELRKGHPLVLREVLQAADHYGIHRTT
jgi:hypothetical protein